MWIDLKVVLLTCSVSVCEHNSSIEGWIHSNRRNRIGQKLVERLVHTHTNLKLEQRLEMYEVGLFPWEIQMTVEESVSDDDDDPPHRVFIFLYFCIVSTHSWKANMLSVTSSPPSFRFIRYNKHTWVKSPTNTSDVITHNHRDLPIGELLRTPGWRRTYCPGENLRKRT
jgi:hypothetical protein